MSFRSADAELIGLGLWGLGLWLGLWELWPDVGLIEVGLWLWLEVDLILSDVSIFLLDGCVDVDAVVVVCTVLLALLALLLVVLLLGLVLVWTLVIGLESLDGFDK